MTQTASRAPARSTRRFASAMIGIFTLLSALSISVGLGVKPAAASHYRATQITWEVVGPNTVEFHINASWRCTFYFGNCSTLSPGDTFNTFDSLDLGDGFFESITADVISVDVTNDVINADAHVTHTYATSGPFLARISTCCRLSSFNGHINNGDGNVVIETIVDLGQTSASPISQISPIVDCALDAVCTFTVPAVDPDGQQLRWRFSNSVEAGGFVQPGPPSAANAATIDASTGLYTWDTHGATLASAGSTFYSTQVTIENLVGSTIVSKTAVDFFIRLGSNSTNQQPMFTAPTPVDGSVIPGTVGSPVTFSVAATDPDAGDTVTLGMLGKPGTATFTTVAGNPANGTFSWTPTAPGDVLITLTAVDPQGLGATARSIILRITAGVTNVAPTADAGPAVAGPEGTALAVDGTVSDPDVGDTVVTSWSATPGPGVDVGATCTFASPAAIDTTVTCTDDGSWTLTLTANDGKHPAVTDTTVATVTNAVPAVSVATPADLSVVAAGSNVALAAPIADAGANDTHTCTVDWGDGTSSTGVVSGGQCTASHAFISANVYTVTVTATDDDGGMGTATVSVVLTDTTTKVSGGGFVVANGRVSFGFIAKRSSTGVLGGQLQVRSGKDKFHGATVSTLTTSGNTASWTGTGRWNGADGYMFVVSVVDNRDGGGKKGTADTIVITIKAPSGATVLTTSVAPLQGGNVTVHR